LNAKSLLSAGTALALALIVASAVRYANRVPTPVPASAPKTEFSAERAMAHVRRMAQVPHPSGTYAHARVSAYVVDELVKLGTEPHIQDVTSVGTRFAVAGRVRNIVARLPGTNRGGQAVMLVSHYDGVAAGPAAGDAASGTAAVLEAMRALREGPPLRNDIIVLITDSEENGLLGAAAFVREHPWAKDVAVLLNFEARGTHGPSFMFETGAGNLDVVRALAKVPGANATSLSTTVYRRLPNDTDLSELSQLQAPALNFAFIGDVARYHTSEDDVAHLDPASVQHHGEQALALARRFGNEPLPRARTSDAVFFTVPMVGIVRYPESWAVPIAIITLALVAFVVVNVRRQEPRWLRDVTFGAIATLLALIVSALAAAAIAIALERIHGSRPLGGNPAWSTTYALATTLLVVAIVAGAYTLTRRWAGASGVHGGALLVWALLSLVVAITLPGASFFFVWPLFAIALVAALAPTIATRPRVSAGLTWFATLFVLFLLVPTTYTMVCVALGLDATGATILAVLTALTTWLLAPHLETLRATRPGITPLVAAIAALVVFGVGFATERTNARNPTGASFIYAVDADSSKAWLSGTATSASGRSWISQAVEQAAGGRREGAMPSWLTRSFDPGRTVPAPLARNIAAPSATVLSDSISGEMRFVTVRVRPGAGTQTLFVAPDNATVVAASVDGRPVDTSRYRSRRVWPLQLVAPPDSGFILALTLRPATSGRAVLGLMGRVGTIPPLEGFQIPRRPAGVLPVQAGDATLIYRRVPLN
jgi:hypothetical protein